MKLIYLKCDSFDVGIGIKIPFFRVLVTIEPGRYLLQFVTTNCLIEYFILQPRWLIRKILFAEKIVNEEELYWHKNYMVQSVGVSEDMKRLKKILSIDGNISPFFAILCQFGNSMPKKATYIRLFK